MPPRYSYWTIIAGGLPTAFRAAEREELLPTFSRLREKQPDAEMKWFARGRLWNSPAEARAAFDAQRNRGVTGDRDRPRRDAAPARRDGRPAERREPSAQGRGREWRPGGEHRDPRQKFKDAKQARNQRWRGEKFERKQARPRDRFDASSPREKRGGGDDGRRPRETNRPAAPKPVWSGHGTRDRTPDHRPHKPDWRSRPPGPVNRPFERRSFGRNQGTEEPQQPPRPRGPNREPRPSESPEPTPPPRPTEPSIPPPPPERGRGRKHERDADRRRDPGRKRRP
jgi:hypothetical protein